MFSMLSLFLLCYLYLHPSELCYTFVFLIYITQLNINYHRIRHLKFRAVSYSVLVLALKTTSFASRNVGPLSLPKKPQCQPLETIWFYVICDWTQSYEWLINLRWPITSYRGSSLARKQLSMVGPVFNLKILLLTGINVVPVNVYVPISVGPRLLVPESQSMTWNEKKMSSFIISF